MEHDSELAWAKAEFGGALLGNALRTARLVAVAAQCAHRPAGRLTEVFDEGAAREGAYRLIENGEVLPAALMRPRHEAAARRREGIPFAFLPLDKTSLNFTDRTGTKGLGMVGTAGMSGQGLQVMTTVAVSPEGVPQGIAGQQMWTRPRKKKTNKKETRRKSVTEKETQRWLDELQSVTESFTTHSPGCRPFFQIDREGDATPILGWAVAHPSVWVTVRAQWDRRVRCEDDQDKRYLWEEMQRQPVRGHYSVNVAAGPGRSARRAKMAVRSARIVLAVPHPTRPRKSRVPCEINVVLAREIGTTPANESPLEWMLLTTHPVERFEDAATVIFGYTQRWRIEEFHKAWKSACRVEQSQLRDADHLMRFAAILASVAVRIVRLTYLARDDQHTPATAEFDRFEIEAVVTLSRLQPIPAAPTVADMVGWLAKLGGYTGESSGGPPGFLVIARGLDRVQAAVALLKLQKGDQ